MSKKVRLKKGIDLPICGEVEDSKIFEKESSEVAVIGPDFIGMKPSIHVKEGETVSPGQKLFSCKKNEGLIFCSRFSGKVVAINRGEKRAFQSMVISLNSSQPDTKLNSVKIKAPESYSREEICETLIETGEWMTLRQRPFEKVAKVGSTPKSLFVTAMDTHPLAPNPEIIINEKKEEFEAGLEILSKLPKEKTYLCVAKAIDVKTNSNVEVAEFEGPHPAGLAGTHMHFLDPVNLETVSWHIGYQDVIAIGHLFLNGSLKKDKVISLVGPQAENPKLVRVLRGAKVSEITSNELKTDKTNRVISGSVLWGRKAEGSFDYLGQYHNQITAIEEDDNREFLGWQSPGFDKFSTKRIYLSKLMPGKRFSLGSSTHGSLRAMVPIGMFERVMPLDILPTQLLRALASGDIEGAQELGCLEIAEEDLGPCTFVAPGKVDFCALLRTNLDKIEREVL